MLVDGKYVYYVSTDHSLIKVDTNRLLKGIESEDKYEIFACEQAVCDDAFTMCHDSVTRAITVLTHTGILFDLETPSRRLDLNTCVKLDDYGWSTVSSTHTRIMVAGMNKSNNSIEYVLVDDLSMTVINRVTVIKNVEVENIVEHIRMVAAESRIVVIGVRSRHIDVLQVINNRLFQWKDMYIGFDIFEKRGSGSFFVTKLSYQPKDSKICIGDQNKLSMIDISLV